MRTEEIKMGKHDLCALQGFPIELECWARQLLSLIQLTASYVPPNSPHDPYFHIYFPYFSFSSDGHCYINFRLGRGLLVSFESPVKHARPTLFLLNCTLIRFGTRRWQRYTRAQLHILGRGSTALSTDFLETTSFMLLSPAHLSWALQTRSNKNKEVSWQNPPTSYSPSGWCGGWDRRRVFSNGLQ